jgi:hypothetical protein
MEVVYGRRYKFALENSRCSGSTGMHSSQKYAHDILSDRLSSGAGQILCMKK